MNYSNDTKYLDTEWTVQFSEIINNYIARVIGGSGVIFNLIFIVLLLHKSFKHTVYNFLWSRAACNLFLSLLATGSSTICYKCSSKSYWGLLYETYVIVVGLRVLALASFISDLFLGLKRYLDIDKNNGFFTKLGKFSNFFICITLSATFFVPSFFCFQIVQIDDLLNEGIIYRFEKTKFGRFFTVYILCLFFIETLIPIVILSFLSILSVAKFKSAMNRQAQLTNNQLKTKKLEARFTKMVSIICTICIVSRCLDLGASFTNRIQILDPKFFDSKTAQYIEIFKSLTNVVLFTVHAFDGIIYLKMDKNISKLVLHFFRITKVNVLSIIVFLLLTVIFKF